MNKLKIIGGLLVCALVIAGVKKAKKPHPDSADDSAGVAR